MKAQFLARFLQLDSRVLLMAMVCTLALIASQSWVLLFKNPITEYRAVQHDGDEREKALLGLEQIPPEIDKLKRQVGELERRLQVAQTQLPSDQMLVAVVGDLDRIAARHGIALMRVKPGADTDVLMFEEISFDIELRGRYESLFAWLRDVETELTALAITQFEIKTVSDSLTINLKVASYRLKNAKDGRK